MPQLRSVQNYTAESAAEVTAHFAELDRQLAAFQAGTETPEWVDELMTDPAGVTMVHSQTPGPTPYIYCKTEIYIPDEV
jgi:hypothetical protein